VRVSLDGVPDQSADHGAAHGDRYERAEVFLRWRRVCQSEPGDGASSQGNCFVDHRFVLRTLCATSSMTHDAAALTTLEASTIGHGDDDGFVDGATTEVSPKPTTGRSP